KFIADRFAKLGLKPLGDGGTFLQGAKFKSTETLPESFIKVGDTTLKHGEDFVALTFSAPEQAEVTGGLVLVGYGVVSPDLKRDDLEGLDLKGKIAIILSGQPKDVDAAAWSKASNPQAVSVNLIGRGAAGIVVANQKSQSE